MIEIDAIIHPDREKRSTAFLEEIQKFIVPKYPNLSIDAEDELKNDVANMQKRLQLIQKLELSDIEKDKLSSSITRIAHRADVQSALFSSVPIDICFEKKKHIKEARKAADEIHDLSMKYNVGDYSEECDLETPPFNIHILCLFK